MEELAILKKHILEGRYTDALAVVEDLEGMSRKAILMTIKSFLTRLVSHLIKNDAEQRLTNSWSASIRNPIVQIQEWNVMGNHTGHYVHADDWRELLENVPALSEYLFRGLRSIQAKYPKVIKEIRGKGLHIGVVLSVPSKQVALDCLKKGLVVNSTNENVIRMMPPLIVSIERIHEALQIFEEVIAGVQV